jgi:hypothetical protein
MYFGRTQMSDQIIFKFNGSIIEITNEYKYLGCIFQNKLKALKEHMSFALTKAARCTYKIQNYCSPLGTPPPALAIKLFNSIVLPTIEYGSEVWSAGVNADCVDTFHVKFLKRVLKLRPQTPTLAVYGETGEYPVSLKLELRVIKYWVRLMTLPDDHIARKMFLSLQSLDCIGFTTWVTHLRKLLEKYDLLELMNNSNVPPNLYKNIKQVVLDHFEEHFSNSIQDSTKCVKLRTYKLFKSTFEYEPYLWLQIPKYRVSLCRLRTSSHLLEIERGRYTIPKTPAEARLCNQCKENLVEHEMHFVITCQKHALLREELISVACTVTPMFHQLSEEEKFHVLLSSQNEQVMSALAKFCYWAFKQRA